MLRIIFLLVSLFILQVAAAGQLVAEDPWIREAPPGAHMMGGFVMLRNTAYEDIVIKSVQAEDFHMAELHLSVVEDGMARMIEQESLLVPARGELELKPGSYHIMLMHPSRALKAGDVSDIRLFLVDGTSLTISFPVVKR